MVINLLTDNRDFILNLYESEAFQNAEQLKETAITVEEPSRVSGAFEGWYELAVTLGIISFPIGLLTNLLSTWIWESFVKSNKPDITIKMVVEKNNTTLEVEFSDIKSIEDIKEKLQLLHSDDNKE